MYISPTHKFMFRKVWRLHKRKYLTRIKIGETYMLEVHTHTILKDMFYILNPIELRKMRLRVLFETRSYLETLEKSYWILKNYGYIN